MAGATGIPWLDNLIQGGQSVVNDATQDITGAAKTVGNDASNFMNYLNQSAKTYANTPTSTPQQTLQAATDPNQSALAALLTGQFNKIVPDLGSTVQNAASGKYKPIMDVMGEADMTPGVGAATASFTPSSVWQDLPDEISQIPASAGKGFQYNNATGQVKWDTPGDPIPYTPSASSANAQTASTAPNTSGQTSTSPPAGGQAGNATTPPAQSGGILSTMGNQIKAHPWAPWAITAFASPFLAAGGNALLSAGELGIHNLDNMLHGQPVSTATPGASTSGTPTPYTTQTAATRYSTTNPISTGMLINPNTYSTTVSNLQQKIGQESLTNPIQAKTDSGVLSALQTQYTTQAPLRNSWSNPQNTGVSQQLQVANEAYSSVNSANPDMLNALSQGYNTLQTASNGQYAQLSKYLQYLQAQTGTDFTQYRTKQSLQSAIDAAANTIQQNWNTQIQNYYGASSPSGVPQGPATGSIPTGPAGNTGGVPTSGSTPGGLQPGFQFGGEVGQ